MDNAIVSFAVGEKFQPLAARTVPAMRAYAHKIGASFRFVDSVNAFPGVDLKGASPTWYKYPLVLSALGEFRRVLFVDADIYIMPEAPDIFQVVPPGSFGARPDIDQWRGMQSLVNLCRRESLGEPLVQKGFYFNAGVMVADRAHAEMFSPPPRYFKPDPMSEQTWLNRRLVELRVPLHELPEMYNHFINRNSRTAGSSFIHFTGFTKKKDLVIPALDAFLAREKLKPGAASMDALSTSELFARLGATPIPINPGRLLEVRVVAQGKTHLVELRARERGRKASGAEPVYLSPAKFASIKPALLASGLKMIPRPMHKAALIASTNRKRVS